MTTRFEPGIVRDAPAFQGPSGLHEPSPGSNDCFPTAKAVRNDPTNGVARLLEPPDED